MNFKGLSNKQAEVLGQMCVGEADGHNPRTLKALEAKGLLVGYDELLNDWKPFPVRVRRYFVPTPVYIEWCVYGWLRELTCQHKEWVYFKGDGRQYNKMCARCYKCIPKGE